MMCFSIFYDTNKEKCIYVPYIGTKPTIEIEMQESFPCYIW